MLLRWEREAPPPDGLDLLLAFARATQGWPSPKPSRLRGLLAPANLRRGFEGYGPRKAFLPAEPSDEALRTGSAKRAPGVLPGLPPARRFANLASDKWSLIRRVPPGLPPHAGRAFAAGRGGGILFPRGGGGRDGDGQDDRGNPSRRASLLGGRRGQ